MASLEGKVIAVTGAGSSIGLAAVHLLAKRGATLSLSNLDKDALEETSRSITK